MSDFEIIYQTDPLRECDHSRERHPSIELTDREHLQKLQPQLVFKKPELDSVPSEKLRKALEIAKNTQIIDLKDKNAKNSRRAIKKSAPRQHKV